MFALTDLANFKYTIALKCAYMLEVILLPGGRQSILGPRQIEHRTIHFTLLIAAQPEPFGGFFKLRNGQGIFGYEMEAETYKLRRPLHRSLQDSNKYLRLSDVADKIEMTGFETSTDEKGHS